MRLAFFFCLMVCAASPAAADDPTLRAESCERAATAQYSACVVYNHFKCSEIAPIVYRVESIDADGVLTIETYDQNRGAIGLKDSSGEVEASFTALTQHPRVALEAGVRKERFEGTLNVLGSTLNMKGRSEYRYKGETLSLAGETFYRMPFEGDVSTSGRVFWTEIAFRMTAQGTMVFNDRLDLWIEEFARTQVDGEPEEVSSLRLLSLPGQNGFGSETPKFGCGELSRLSYPGTEAPA